MIPLLTHEIEPIGGFGSDIFALPIYQGGTFVTILVFMFVQDPILGTAAITLLPVQLALIPRMQRRINKLVQRRLAEVRQLGGELGQQSSDATADKSSLRSVSFGFKNLERIRRDIHKAKFLMKAVNNLLTALTPFFFYAVGGYLVINDRLSFGALVAVLAAYKDFSAPLKELFRYYQNFEDVRIRYENTQHFLGMAPHRPLPLGAFKSRK